MVVEEFDPVLLSIIALVRWCSQTSGSAQVPSQPFSQGDVLTLIGLLQHLFFLSHSFCRLAAVYIVLLHYDSVQSFSCPNRWPQVLL